MILSIIADSMALDKSDVNAAKGILEADETAVMTARQRRIGPGGSMMEPTSVVVTNKRIIIINRATLGIRKDFETIPFTQITSVRLEKGIISSSVFVRVMGFDMDKGLLEGGKEEGEIDGLSGKDAKELSDYINQKVLELQEGTPEAPAPTTGEKKEECAYCEKCGSKNDIYAKYCTHCGAKL